MDNRTKELEARIKAANRANAYANEIYPKLVAIFEPLVGSAIEKADGCLLAKVAKLLPEFPSEVKLHVYRHASNYSLAWCVKTCETSMSCAIDSHTGIANYFEVTVYIGELQGPTLTKITPPCQRRTDYKLEEVLSLRKKAKEAKEVYEKARDACYPFGEGY